MDPRVGSLRIAEARARDALALRALHRGVLEEGRWFVRDPDELPALDEVEQAVDRYRRSDNSAWFVARLPREPVVGMLTMTGGALRRTLHVARLEVMVAKAHRGKGIGRALVEHALAWARENELVSKVSLAVFDDNARALELYAELGFVEEGRRPGEYRDADGAERGDVLMAVRV